MKKSFLGLLILSTLCANAIASDFPKDTKIYTDNFQIKPIDQRSNSLNTKLTNQSNDQETLGILGEYKVVQGEKKPHQLAFIVEPNSKPVIIENSILVRCKKDRACLNNQDQIKKIGKDLYEITISSYDEWVTTMDELKANENVKKIMPKLDYGTKQVLN